MRTSRRCLALFLVGPLLLGGCARSERFDPQTPPLTKAYVPQPEGVRLEKAGTVQGRAVQSTDILGSLRPDPEQTPESLAQALPAIMQRGRLIVGVDQSQNLLSFRDSTSGEIRGFEIDIVREIAQDLFGDPSKVELRFVNSSNWISALEEGQIDMAIRGVSITRDRQNQVMFSTPYLSAETRLLVETKSNIESVDDLAGKTACVTAGSTGLERTRLQAPHTDILIANAAADCLVALQQAHADAIVSDDAILSGMAAQDPFSTITGPSLGTEQYGIAFAQPGLIHHNEALIRAVNGTLERMFRDGTWYRLFQQWLAEYLPPQAPPPLHYER